MNNINDLPKRRKTKVGFSLPKIGSLNRKKDEPIKEEVPEGYIKDKKTGKVYKELPRSNSEAVKAFKKNNSAGLSLDELFKYTEEVEGFDLDDLQGSADKFLAHLRVPPNKKEQAELRELRAKLRREQEEEYTKVLDEIPTDEIIED